MFRNVTIDDFNEIKDLYKQQLSFDISKDIYDYYYKIDNDYCSRVIEINNRIVGHHAIISKEYLFENSKIKVGLFSGGMVNTNYSGVFLKLLRNSINEFKGDLMIAFPNKNSEPFFTKLLKFNPIKNNFFTITKEELVNNSIPSTIIKNNLTSDCFEKRINNHPYNKYLKKVKENTFIIYKKFNDTEIDLIYTSALNRDFYFLLHELLNNECEKINMILGSSEKLKPLGFKMASNNTFVFKWLNKKFSNKTFNCQMIDSDVF